MKDSFNRAVDFGEDVRAVRSLMWFPDSLSLRSRFQIMLEESHLQLLLSVWDGSSDYMARVAAARLVKHQLPILASASGPVITDKEFENRGRQIRVSMRVFDILLRCALHHKALFGVSRAKAAIAEKENIGDKIVRDAWSRYRPVAHLIKSSYVGAELNVAPPGKEPATEKREIARLLAWADSYRRSVEPRIAKNDNWEMIPFRDVQTDGFVTPEIEPLTKADLSLLYRVEH